MLWNSMWYLLLKLSLVGKAVNFKNAGNLKTILINQVFIFTLWTTLNLWTHAWCVGEGPSKKEEFHHWKTASIPWSCKIILWSINGGNQKMADMQVWSWCNLEIKWLARLKTSVAASEDAIYVFFFLSQINWEILESDFHIRVILLRQWS